MQFEFTEDQLLLKKTVQAIQWFTKDHTLASTIPTTLRGARDVLRLVKASGR